MAGEGEPIDVPAETGRVIGGKYRLKRRLAEGGMGAVWLARHEALDADVAVKLMSAEISGTELAIARFEREAKASAKLKSNHVVRVHDYGVDGDVPFMVMELLDGEDLGRRLKRDGPMTMDQLLPLLRQIAKGLEVAHAAGFVHRDLKPSNIFIAKEGTDEVVKIVDFGVARETKTNIVEDKTSSGVVLGSPHHMSPEQARGKRVDHRSDLWALGVLIYRALTGTLPFDAEVLATLLLEIVSKPVPKITERDASLPSDIDRFFAHALSRNVDRRFHSATAMVDAFEAVAAGKDIEPFVVLAPDQGETEGRDQPTMPSVDAADIPQMEPRDERSMSRALNAVTAGMPVSRLSRRMRPWSWVALAAAVAVVAFFIGRSPSNDFDLYTGASGPDPSGPTAPVPPAPGGTATVGTATVSTSSAASTPSATSPPVVSPPVVSPPRTEPPRTEPPRTAPPRTAPPRTAPVAQPKPAPKVDPFTGLPTK